MHDMREKATGRITISSDIEGDTVQDMLTHLYGGRIENMEEKAAKIEVLLCMVRAHKTDWFISN